MSSVNIDFIKRSIPQITEGSPSVRVVPEDSYTFKDIKLDLELGELYGNAPTDKAVNLTDVRDIRDIRAIQQSISNIFNTKRIRNDRYINGTY